MSSSNGQGVPRQLAEGVPMLKVSSKKIKPVIVTLSPSNITWPSLKGGRVEIRAIRELRLGQSPTDAYDGARWITIVYVRDKQWKVVHFIAHTDDVYQLWVRALHDLVSTGDKVVSGAHGPGADPDYLFIRQLWPAGAATIDRPTATSLFAQLGIAAPQAEADKVQFPIDMATFRQLVRDSQTRPELDELHKRLGNMDREQVIAFLRDVQGEDGDVGDVFERYADPSCSLWTAESLSHYLVSQDNVPRTLQDLTRPLPEYYIASSHNTYLVAGQWRGQSTVEGYVRVLLDGCRCVESELRVVLQQLITVDVHNGDHEPVVYHANTITSKVSAREVCQAIKKYAFVASPYPVVISLEVRCSVEQQDKLAQIIVDVFGDTLLTSPLEGVEGIPSPTDLKGRILVKSKAAVQPPAAEKILSQATLSASPPPMPVNDSTTDSTTESDSSIMRFARRLSMSGGERKSSSGISKILSDLPVYTSGVKYRGFSKLVTYEPQHMFSVSERTANRIIRDGQEPDWVKHNFTHLSRVYPKAVRLSSSNFDPRPYWAAGAQMVAINYQTLDDGSLLNHAMFRDGGYVLKPSCLRYKTSEPPAHIRLRVKIISAQRLPLNSELFVEATVRDMSRKTRVAKGCPISPLWNEAFEFSLDTRESCLAIEFLHLELKSKDRSTTIAQWIRPLAQAGQGYRYLPLEDSTRSRYLFATLFVKIDLHVSPVSPSRSPKISPRSPKHEASNGSASSSSSRTRAALPIPMIGPYAGGA